MNNPQKLELCTTAYWQFRAKEMSGNMIMRKMAMSKVDRERAEAGFRKWILEKTYIRIGSWETLTADECKTIVAFLHRHQGAFKNSNSITA